ncbi:hypothetical protein OIDMADRAFT_27737 [Oidiodendron maius Zn]|uniref:Uncharacterized protein n=1 Tax=Oidiodendron maius (strain Zn) TaxID=913774 RepID=A0A0C3HLT2_OIDMZ|nr:hypothetical protein OIDMADRAFT_27737 [Oidiodendron maius Zn]
MLTGGHRHGRQPVGSSQQTPFKDGPHTGMKVSERKLAKKERTKGKWKVGRGTGSQRPAILVYGSAILKGSPPMDGIVVDTGYSEAEQSKNKEVIDSIWEEEQTNKEDPLQEREPNQGTSAIKPIRNDEGLKQHSASFEASQQGTTAVFEPADQIPSTGTDTEQISRDPGHIPDAVSAGRKIYKYQCLDGVPPSNESLRIYPAQRPRPKSSILPRHQSSTPYLAEKEDLIHQEILPFSYRSRQIAIVTARSMFRQFGSRVIVNGRRVRDDYWETKARKQRFTEEDLAGEKRPGATKARDVAAAEASATALLTLGLGLPELRDDARKGRLGDSDRVLALLTDLSEVSSIALSPDVSKSKQKQPISPQIPQWQSLNGLDILADAAATRATTTQPRELPDLGHQTGACSIPTTPYTQSDTIYDDTTYNRELLSFHHKSLLSQEVFPQSVMREDICNEAVDEPDDSLSDPQQDENTSGRGEVDEDKESDIEFIAGDVDIESDSETDLSLDKEDIDIEDTIKDTL